MKYVIVTGASGGMGKTSCKFLKEKGYEVISLDKEIEEDSPLNIKCDITSNDSVINAFNKIKEITDDVYAIIHFAGIYYLDSLVEIDDEKYERIFKINVIGPFLINKYFLPLLHSGSKILLTTSELATYDPLPFTGLYGITKTTLDKYSYSLAMELQFLGIRVSVLRPGAVKTDMLKASTDELDDFCDKTKLYNISANNFKKVVNNVEAKYITPDKIARKVVKILNKKNPKFSYQINRNKLLILLNILPKRWRFKIIKKILNKKK